MIGAEEQPENRYVAMIVPCRLWIESAHRLNFIPSWKVKLPQVSNSGNLNYAGIPNSQN